jgi:hypothetical protein
MRNSRIVETSQSRKEPDSLALTDHGPPLVGVRPAKTVRQLSNGSPLVGVGPATTAQQRDLGPPLVGVRPAKTAR